MEQSRSKGWGIDVHGGFLVATILERNGQKMAGHYHNRLEQRLILKEWGIMEHCPAVILESAEEYSISLCEVLQSYKNMGRSLLPIRVTSKGLGKEDR